MKKSRMFAVLAAMTMGLAFLAAAMAIATATLPAASSRIQRAL